MNDFIYKLISLRRKKKLLLIITVLSVILGFIFFSDYGVLKSIKLATDRSDIKNKLEELVKKNDSLRIQIHEMKNDTLEIEKIAREKYGMIKEREKVYIKLNDDND